MNNLKVSNKHNAMIEVNYPIKDVLGVDYDDLEDETGFDQYFIIRFMNGDSASFKARNWYITFTPDTW